jgi:hypothetical protein
MVCRSEGQPRCRAARDELTGRRDQLGLVNFGHLAETARKIAQSLAQFALAIALPIPAELIDWRDRWAFVSVG